MKQKKILFTDMDGTILFSDHGKTYFNEDKIVVTLIATGMSDTPNNNINTPVGFTTAAPSFEPKAWKTKTPRSQAASTDTGIVIPKFLLEAQKKR